MRPTIYNYEGYYLIVLKNYNLSDFRTIFENLFRLHIINANIIVTSKENTEEVLFYTFFPFKEHGCSQINPILWNTFRNGNFTSNKLFYPKKLKNMNKCPVTIATFEKAPFILLSKNQNNYSLTGIEGKLINFLSERMNFTQMIIIPNNAFRGIIYENGSSTGASKLIYDGLANVSIGEYGITVNVIKYMDVTYSYMESSLAFAIPLPRALTSLEKFFVPFDIEVWMYLWSTVSIVCILITILKNFTNKICKKRLGLSELSLFNMLGVIMGNPMKNLTKHNFYRKIAIICLVSSYVIRTAYQGILFKNFHQLNRVKATYTFNELIEEDYKFFISGGALADYFSEMPEIIKRTQITLDVSLKHSDAVKVLSQSQNKFAYLKSNVYMAYLNNINFKYGNQYPRTIDELFLLQIVFCVQKSSYLRNAFNEEIEIYLSNGLMMYWIKMFIEEKNTNLYKRNVQQKQLTFDELWGTFQICLIFYFFSLIVFVLELFYWHLFVVKRFL